MEIRETNNEQWLVFMHDGGCKYYCKKSGFVVPHKLAEMLKVRRRSHK